MSDTACPFCKTEDARGDYDAVSVETVESDQKGRLRNLRPALRVERRQRPPASCARSPSPTPRTPFANRMG